MVETQRGDFTLLKYMLISFVVLVAFSATPVASQQQLAALGCGGSEPTATAQWIYKNAPDFYVGRIGRKGRQAYLSPELYKLLEREWKCQEPGELCAIETYPWTNAQDGEVLEPIAFKLKSQTSSLAIVEMTYLFGFPDELEKAVPKAVQLRLVRTSRKTCWLLDDITNGTLSVKRNMAEWPYYEAQRRRSP